jgi:NAD(P)H-dependent FMN reductase
LPKLHIIIGSTRPGRVGPGVARWFQNFARAHGKFEPVLIDLKDFNLPVYDEPKHPMTKQYAHAHTKTWSASVADADAFVFVTPEYNYVAPPALVNALNYVFFEWNYKPAGIVSYGGVSGGLRAAQSLKSILTTLKIVPLTEGVPIPNVGQMFDKDGTLAPNDLITVGAKAMLDELARWTGALQPLRVA